MTSTTTRATGTPGGVVLVRKAVAQAYPEEKSTRVDKVALPSRLSIGGDIRWGTFPEKRMVPIAA
ncbi:hypothetical protein GCM10010246_72450 [Streptomyces cuspidosporus]|uniref:Uncharacterized protein n=1 Tax=Streptomyces cuspidosporus TaxID=66882 RepID=A0ABN3H3B4_9ACTN